MAFINKQGKSISYECSELIEELKADIEEFGGSTIVAVWCREYEGVTIYVNYDFICDDEPVETSELRDGEYIKQMSMTALSILLEEQNRII
jgi:hypothetical protein